MEFMQNFIKCRQDRWSPEEPGRRISRRKDFLIITFLITSTFYLFFFKMGEPSLWQADEPIYGEVSKQIMKLGDWITPHFNYKEWFDKPPLYMWITSIFYRIFGCSEFSTRLASSLFGTGEIILVYIFGKVLFNRKAGFFAAFSLATSMQFLIQSRLALLDVPLTFFITLSFFFFYIAFENPQRKVFLYSAFLSMALATLTKGPVGFLLPLVAFFFFLFLTKNLHRLKQERKTFLLAFLIFFIASSWWYLAQIYIHGRAFIDNFFILRNIKRFTTPFEGHTGPFYYYIPVLLLGFFPWSSFLPLSFFYLKKGKKHKTLLIFSWILVIFLFFSSARSKLPGYILPLYPACALCVGRMWDILAKENKKTKKQDIFFSFLFLFFLITAFTFFIFIFAKNSYPYEYSIFKKGILLLVSFFSITGFISFLFGLKKNIFLSFSFLSAGIFLAVAVLTLQIFPATESLKPTRELAIKVKNSLNSGGKVGNYPAFDKNFMSFNASFVFYVDRKVVGIEDLEDLKAFLSSRERAFCLMSKKNYEKIKRKIEAVPFYIFAEKNGEIVITNEKNS